MEGSSLDLPDHILHTILHYLSWPRLIKACTLVSRTWSTAVQEHCVVAIRIDDRRHLSVGAMYRRLLASGTPRDIVVSVGDGEDVDRVARLYVALDVLRHEAVPMRAFHLDLTVYTFMDDGMYIHVLREVAALLAANKVQHVALRLPNHSNVHEAAELHRRMETAFRDCLGSLMSHGRQTMRIRVPSKHWGQDSWKTLLRWALHDSEGLREIVLECDDTLTYHHIVRALLECHESSASLGGRLQRLRFSFGNGCMVDGVSFQASLLLVETLVRSRILNHLEIAVPGARLVDVASSFDEDCVWPADRRPLRFLCLDLTHAALGEDTLEAILVRWGPAYHLRLCLDQTQVSSPARWYMIGMILAQWGWKEVHIEIRVRSSFGRSVHHRDNLFARERAMLCKLAQSRGLSMCVHLINVDGTTLTRDTVDHGLL